MQVKLYKFVHPVCSDWLEHFILLIKYNNPLVYKQSVFKFSLVQGPQFN